MPKSVDKEIQLEVVLPNGPFAKTLHFNRLRVDKDDGFCFVQFGLVVASDLVDSYSCVLSEQTLKQNRDSLLTYVNKLESGSEEPVGWKGVTASRSTDVVDIISMSFRGNYSETAFFVFSMCAASKTASNPQPSVSSQFLVILRSTAALQRQLITTLYGES